MVIRRLWVMKAAFPSTLKSNGEAIERILQAIDKAGFSTGGNQASRSIPPPASSSKAREQQYAFRKPDQMPKNASKPPGELLACARKPRLSAGRSPINS